MEAFLLTVYIFVKVSLLNMVQSFGLQYNANRPHVDLKTVPVGSIKQNLWSNVVRCTTNSST